MFTSENNKKEFIEISDVIKVVQEENNYFFKIIIKYFTHDYDASMLFINYFETYHTKLHEILGDEYNCDKTTSPLEERERIIEEYEDKLNDLTLEIYEKQTRLEDLERSLTRRQARLEVKEKNLEKSGFDNVFHLSVVILVGYTATKIIALFFN